MRNNTSSWFPCSMIDKHAPKDCMFGPSQFNNEHCWLYPNRRLKLNSTLIWLPKHKIHIGIASYVDAQLNNDAEALNKLKSLGIPLGMKFSSDNDFSGTYVIDEPKKKSVKKPSVSVMKVNFDGTYEDGSTFKAGDTVKITFRNKFVGYDRSGKKTFANSYERA